jgi:hypothetical protein
MTTDKFNDFINDLVEEWHTSGSNLTLNAYMGVPEVTYARWVEGKITSYQLYQIREQRMTWIDKLLEKRRLRKAQRKTFREGMCRACGQTNGKRHHCNSY